MNEKILEKKLRDGVKKLGGIALKFSSPHFTGFPDRIVLMPHGSVWFVEMKSTGQKTTSRQELVIGDLRKMDHKVWVIDNTDLLTQFLKEISK